MTTTMTARSNCILCLIMSSKRTMQGILGSERCTIRDAWYKENPTLSWICCNWHRTAIKIPLKKRKVGLSDGTWQTCTRKREVRWNMGISSSESHKNSRLPRNPCIVQRRFSIAEPLNVALLSASAGDYKLDNRSSVLRRIVQWRFNSVAPAAAASARVARCSRAN
jgi:hypothetical protein